MLFPPAPSHVALTILSICTLTSANLLDCPDACRISFSRVTFTGSPSTDKGFVLECTNRFRVQSVFYCMKTRCSDAEIDVGLHELSNLCHRYASAELLPWTVISNISEELARSWPRIGLGDLSNEITYSGPAQVSDSLFTLSFKTSAAWNHEFDVRINYGYAMFAFFTGTFLISVLARVFHYLSCRRRLHNHAMVRNQWQVWRKLSLATKQHLTTPAMFTQHAAEPLGLFTIPQRWQSLQIIAFTMINVVFCVVSYDLFEGNLYWPTTHLQFWRYVSDRTGILSTANLPLMFAFGMRNNILSWLSGWDFPTCNIFHRWIARIATIEAIIHSIGYTIFALLNGGMDEYLGQWKLQYWWMGAIATVTMSLLCGFSIYPIRQLYYEGFLVVHGSLSILFLVGMWYHVAIFQGKYNPLLWPCITVWIFDRLARIARRAYLNSSSAIAIATYDTTSDIIRITAPIRLLSKPQPGTFYYIYDLDDIRPWESHPFTLSTWETDFDPDQHKISFIIRPYDSYTSRLRSRILEAQSSARILLLDSTSKSKIRLSIEGAYGQSHTLNHFHSVLFIVGGTGITVTLAHLQAMRETVQNKSNLLVRNIHIVWAVRNEALLANVYQHELASYFESSVLAQVIEVTIDVHITRGPGRTIPTKRSIENETPSATTNRPKISKAIQCTTSDLKDDNGEGSNSSSFRKSTSHLGQEMFPKQVRIIPNRPHIDNLVQNAASMWASHGRRLAVVCCGPAKMADDTRAAIIDAYASGYEGIDLWNETFTW